MKTTIKAPHNIGTMDAMQFIRDELGKYDLSELSKIRVYHKDYDRRHPLPDAYGKAFPPNPRGKTYDVRNTYRINLNVRGRSEDLPWDRKDYPAIKPLPIKYARFAYPGELYTNLEELLVFIAGHEAYHYLCWTGQIRKNARSEPDADFMGDEWVQKYIDWRNDNV